jgi:UDP-N-acetylmuramyl tripeptide synthase
LIGSNLFFAGGGAVLEARVAVDDALIERWRALVLEARAALSWPERPIVARRHATGAQLALGAPVDQLYTATEVNEWALCAALALLGRAPEAELLGALREAATDNPSPPAAATGLAPELARQAALARLKAVASAERNPALRALMDAARARGLPYMLDDDRVTLGFGSGMRAFALDALPALADVPWDALHAIPLAVVTGSNGKTTTVRLIAAALDAAGFVSGHCCTDGVFVAGEAIGEGDYSGPQGARRVLRDPRATAAVIETARGGILRRGLAFSRADVAVVTNVSADHFGEYGIHDLDGLADAKLAVARLVDGSVDGRKGLLVLDADDALLHARGEALAAAGTPVAWFALEFEDAEAADGHACCGVRDGRLVLKWDGALHTLGPIAALPLTAGGVADYNTRNLAAAALAARALGVPVSTIAKVFAHFGADPRDNPGRLERHELGGLQLVMDYAHNAEGLDGLLRVAEALRGSGSHRGRLALLLGHAGNRQQGDFERLAASAAAARPDLVVVKEIEGFERGRARGEVPRLIRQALLDQGLPERALALAADEIGAVRHALAWAHAGDVLVLPVHALAARAAAHALFDQLRARGWQARQPLP